MVETVGGYTMLMLKVEEGELEEVKRILSESTANIIDYQNKSGQTALFLAVRRGNLAMVGALLMKSANIKIRNKSGQTALSIACWYNHESIARLLIESGADIDSADHRGWTPITISVYHDNLRLTQMLLEYGPDLNARDTFGKSVFQRVQSAEIKKLLTEYISKEGLNLSDYHRTYKCSQTKGSVSKIPSSNRLVSQESKKITVNNISPSRAPNSKSPAKSGELKNSTLNTSKSIKFSDPKSTSEFLIAESPNLKSPDQMVQPEGQKFTQTNKCLQTELPAAGALRQREQIAKSNQYFLQQSDIEMKKIKDKFDFIEKEFSEMLLYNVFRNFDYINSVFLKLFERFEGQGEILSNINAQVNNQSTKLNIHLKIQKVLQKAKEKARRMVEIREQSPERGAELDNKAFFYDLSNHLDRFQRNMNEGVEALFTTLTNEIETISQGLASERANNFESKFLLVTSKTLDPDYSFDNERPPNRHMSNIMDGNLHTFEGIEEIRASKETSGEDSESHNILSNYRVTFPHDMYNQTPSWKESLRKLEELKQGVKSLPDKLPSSSQFGSSFYKKLENIQNLIKYNVSEKNLLSDYGQYD